MGKQGRQRSQVCRAPHGEYRAELLYGTPAACEELESELGYHSEAVFPVV